MASSFSLHSPTAAQESEPGKVAAPESEMTSSAFDYARLSRASQALAEQTAAFIRNGDLSKAEMLARQAVTHAPQLPSNHYNLACVLALAGRPDDALENLARAVALGYSDGARLERDEDLRSLRQHARFRSLVESTQASPRRVIAPNPISPRAIEEGVAWVGPGNTGFDPVHNVLRTQFSWPARDVSLPSVRGHGVVGDKLRRWFNEGSAAGNHGDLYDNCDRDHSNMRYADFPHLARIEYEPEVQRDVPFGLQLGFFHGGVVLGNSSTAHVGSPFWRSNPRTAYVNPHAVALLYEQYRSNCLYIYPEHRDHDPGHDGKPEGFGDVFPANTPYLITSQGSSGSDQVFLDAVACTLAAFSPTVKERLAELGLLMPVVQMIFRDSNKNVARPEDYLTGAAHPTVFDGKQLNVDKMVETAHAIQLENLPPWVEIKVVEEDQFVPGRDYFDIGPRERLFDSPCSIARVYRALARQRRMVVSAEGSRDANGRPLTYHWVVLRGDARSVRINKLNELGSRAEIIVEYADRRPVVEGSDLESNRVEVGVFVHNGVYYSPPAFISWMTLDNEQREYDERGRILSVLYRGGTDAGHYVDPVIDLPKSWRDEYHYDDGGQLRGWTRARGTEREEFTSDGALIVERDDRGRPRVARTVRYLVRPRPDRQPPMLVQELGPERVVYQYRDESDRVGLAAREPWELSGN